MQDRIEALLAQVGFWAGRRVGRTHAQIRWIVFKLYVDFRKGTGYTEMQIAQELRAMYYRRRIQTRSRAMMDNGYTISEICNALDITVAEMRKALGITEHEIGSNPN